MTDPRYRYIQKSAPRHPRASASGVVLGHILIAERALGRLLPQGVEVHHVNGDPRDNRGANLVICQDRAYHKLLHYRARIVRAGGEPDTQKICSGCRLVLALGLFSYACGSGGRQNYCRACASAVRAVRTATERAQRAAA